MKHVKKTTYNDDNDPKHEHHPAGAAVIHNEWVDPDGKKWETGSLKRGPKIVSGVEVLCDGALVHISEGKHHEQALQEALVDPNPVPLRERRKEAAAAEAPKPAPRETPIRRRAAEGPSATGGQQPAEPKESESMDPSAATKELRPPLKD